MCVYCIVYTVAYKLKKYQTKTSEITLKDTRKVLKVVLTTSETLKHFFFFCLKTLNQKFYMQETKPTEGYQMICLYV